MKGTLPALSAWLRRQGVQLTSSNSGLAAVAIVVGIGAGLGAVVFRALIQLATQVLTGYQDYSDAGRAANPLLPGLGPWFVLLTPVAAGLVYGPLVSRFAPEARGHGVPEVMLAVANNAGRIRARVAVIKALASAVCIGGGGSVGREGPIVQIGSAIGSAAGQLVGAPERALRVLVACGSAGAIAATFNAPIAGVFFALELILQDFATAAFGVVVLSAVVASIIGRAAFGGAPFLHLPDFSVTSPLEAIPYAILGILGAAVGVMFTRVLYGTEDLCDKLWRGPEWLRPAVGGLLLGTLLLWLPQLYGVGYPVLGHAIAGDYVVVFLLVLLFGKMLATSLTIGIGGSGGVFAPSLFMGAMLGTVVGTIAHLLAPTVVTSPGAYGIIGMGAVFAGAARAPITAVMIIFELTGDYSVILPLMAAIVVATALSSRISGAATIYTLKLQRRGVTLRRGRVISVIGSIPVAEAMRSPLATVDASADVRTLLPRLTKEGSALVVLDSNDAYVGVLGADLADTLISGDHTSTSAADVASRVPVVGLRATLDEAIGVLLDAGVEGVPVMDTATGAITGWIGQVDILRAYRRARASSGRSSAVVGGRSGPVTRAGVHSGATLD